MFSPYSGSGCLLHRWEYKNIDDWFVSPPIKVNSDILILSFYEKNEYISYYVYSGVYVSEVSDNPANGNFIEVYESKNILQNYTKKEIFLNGYKDKTIYIGFRYKGYNAHNWYIDDIKLERIAEYFEDLSLIYTNLNFENYILGAPQYAKLVVQNKGTTTISDTTKIRFYVNDVLKEVKQLGKNLLPGQRDTVYFTWDNGYGYFNIKFEKVSSDYSVYNDTLKSSCYIVSNNSIIQDFENVNTLTYGYIYKSNKSVIRYHNSYKNFRNLLINNESNDTLFLNKYTINENSHLIFFSYGYHCDYNVSLLYSLDGKEWLEYSTKNLKKGEYCMVDFYLRSFKEKDIFIALRFNSQSFINYIYLDYMLLPQPINTQVVSDLFELLGEE